MKISCEVTKKIANANPNLYKMDHISGINYSNGCDIIKNMFSQFMNEYEKNEEAAIKIDPNIMRSLYIIGTSFDITGFGNSADYSWISIRLLSNAKEDITIIYKIERDTFHNMDFDKIDIIIDNGGIKPTRAHEIDAGLDLYSPNFCMIPPNGRSIIDTRIHVDIPNGYVGKLESKSGLMRNKGITCRGTIDAGYHGTIQAVIFNHSDKPVMFEEGDKITQLVIYPIAIPRINVVDKFESESERGEGGFGSTGK